MTVYFQYGTMRQRLPTSRQVNPPNCLYKLIGLRDTILAHFNTPALCGNVAVLAFGTGTYATPSNSSHLQMRMKISMARYFQNIRATGSINGVVRLRWTVPALAQCWSWIPFLSTANQRWAEHRGEYLKELFTLAIPTSNGCLVSFCWSSKFRHRSRRASTCLS